MNIAVASDHGGFPLKDCIVDLLKRLDHVVQDLGTFSTDSVDYPDLGAAVAVMVSRGGADAGVLLCGTGIGMSIVANKFPGVRAALVGDVYAARMAKEHNNANIVVLGGRMVGPGLAEEIVRVWLEATFQGGRHQKRLDKITEIEGRTCAI